MTGVPGRMVTGSSGGIGRAGEAERLALYVMEGLGWMVLTAGNGMVKSLWVRIKGQTSNADVIVGVYSRPPIQNSGAGELFFKKLRDICKLTTLVLMGDFSLANVNWEYHTANTSRSSRFLNSWMISTDT